MWRVLSARRLKRNDREDEIYSKTSERLRVIEEHHATVHSLPEANASRELQTDAEQSETDVDRLPQTDAGLSGSASRPHVPGESSATVGIGDMEADDIVIVVMGPTGSGKSTFIRIASGRDTLGVGHTLKSFTSQVNVIRFWDQDCGRHVVLVDTPGFDDTYKSDLEILNMISEWLNSSYKKRKLLSGILYLHRIMDNRMAGTPLRNLRVFRKLCGKDALDRVCLVTTMWDEVDPNVGEKRLAELEQEYWKAMIAQGAQIARCRSDDDSAKIIVQQVLHEEAARKAVLLQKEMSDLGVALRETEAGQELHSHLEKLVEKQLVLLKRIDQERRRSSDPDMLTELQTEYDALRAQIDAKLQQVQELKLSRFQNLCRFLTRKRD